MKAVLFDLDGTLLNTTEGILESVRYVIGKFGLKEKPYDILLRFVGPPIQNSFAKYFNFSAEESQKAADLFRSYYKENALFKAKPYPGVFDVLGKLKKNDIIIAVVTYKREDYARTILEHFGIMQFCSSIHGADNHNVLTKAEIVSNCIHELGVEKKNVLLVGDTEYDAIGAQQAGVSFLGVTYGFGFKSKENVDTYPNIGYADDICGVMKYIMI